MALYLEVLKPKEFKRDVSASSVSLRERLKINATNLLESQYFSQVRWIQKIN